MNIILSVLSFAVHWALKKNQICNLIVQKIQNIVCALRLSSDSSIRM